MAALKDVLNLEGETPVEIILGADGAKKYEEVKKLLGQKAEPELRKYLNSLNIANVLQKADTMEILQKTEVTYITVEFKTLLADLIDSVKKLTVAQKIYLFNLFLSTFYHGAAAYVTPYFNARAEQLQSKQPKSRIIKPFA